MAVICKESGDDRCRECGIGTYRDYNETSVRCDFCCHVKEVTKKK